MLRKSTQELFETICENPDLIEFLEWRDLERVIALCYDEIGFDTVLTGSAKDGGKDVVIKFTANSKIKDIQRVYIEIKHWRQATPVGKSTVRRLLEVALRDGVTGALIVSSSGFTSTVKQDSSPVKLGDLSTIRNLCHFAKVSLSGGEFSGGKLEEYVCPTQASFTHNARPV